MRQDVNRTSESRLKPDDSRPPERRQRMRRFDSLSKNESSNRRRNVVISSRLNWRGKRQRGRLQRIRQ
jgi:hypothetical protein